MRDGRGGPSSHLHEEEALEIGRGHVRANVAEVAHVDALAVDDLCQARQVHGELEGGVVRVQPASKGRDSDSKQMVRRLEDLAVVRVALRVELGKVGIRVGRQGDAIALDELGPEDLVEEGSAHALLGSWREDAGKVEDVVAPVRANVALNVCRGVYAHQSVLARPDVVALDVEGGRSVLHDGVEVGVLGKDGIAAVRGAVDVRLLVDGQNALRHEAEATVVNHSHQGHVQVAAAKVAHEALELEAARLHGVEVAAVDALPVLLQLEEDA